jgi:hypothetical protein
MDTNATIAALSAGADDGRRFDFLFAKLGARRLGMGELLADTIADLPEGERLFFTLYYFEELETSEIALVLGETVFAVLQLHVSALVRLQDRLADPDSGLLDQIRAVDRTMDEGRAAKIANIKKAIAEGTYHVSAAEVARRLVDQIDEP